MHPMAKRMPVAAGGGWAAPDPVLDLAAVADDVGGITLTWTQAFGATGYDIQRSLTNGNFATIASDQTGATYYDSTGDPTTLYYFRIIAKRGQIPSVPSNVASATTTSAFTGVLDDYMTNLVAAYLPFRGFTIYEGDCFTIRDTVGDAEQEVGFDAVTGELNAFTVGGSAAVKTWHDQSATTAGLVQATAANQPILTLNVVNNQPVVRFDGTSDELTGSATASAARTIFMVVKKRSAVDYNTAIAYQGVDGGCMFHTSLFYGTDWRYYADSTGTLVEPCGGAPTEWSLMVLKYASDGTLTPYADLATGTPFAARSTYDNSASFSLGAGGGSSWADVDIGACLIYAAELGDTAREAIRNILGIAFGQPWVP